MHPELTLLKTEARLLHRKVRHQDPKSQKRIVSCNSSLAPSAPDPLTSAAKLATLVKRRHCLATIAKELGFNGWPHIVSVLCGDNAENFGTLLYPRRSSAYWNIWSASYPEARQIRADHGGYLLAYRHHYLIVDEHFVRRLGLDPDHRDWQLIGRDWVAPQDLWARNRLYGQLFAAQLKSLA